MGIAFPGLQGGIHPFLPACPLSEPAPARKTPVRPSLRQRRPSPENRATRDRFLLTKGTQYPFVGHFLF
jgi:hypothetical protein